MIAFQRHHQFQLRLLCLECTASLPEIKLLFPHQSSLYDKTVLQNYDPFLLVNSSYNNYYPQQQEDRPDARKKLSNPKFVEVTKFIKRGTKDVDITVFLLLELIRVFSLAPEGFLLSPYVQRHLKKDREFSYLLTRNSQSIL